MTESVLKPHKWVYLNTILFNLSNHRLKPADHFKWQLPKTSGICQLVSTALKRIWLFNTNICFTYYQLNVKYNQGIKMSSEYFDCTFNSCAG